MRYIIKTLIFISIIFFSMNSYTQNIDIASIGKGKAFNINGGLSSNMVYKPTAKTSTEEFNYYMQGSLNLSFYMFTMPISYSISNDESLLNSDSPFDFNTLSLHPTYKWVSLHIGDVNMSFSPYTLNGYQFTGGGMDLSPPIGLKISAMGGELIKPVKYNSQDISIEPQYKRMGYGIKLGLSRDQYNIGLILFTAKDEISSIGILPEDSEISPKENLAIQLDASLSAIENIEITVMYASSAITKNSLSDTGNNKKEGLASLLINNKSSTEYYDAVSTDINTKIGKYNLGIGYQRVDTGYETLGVLYSNNDFENIQLSVGSSFMGGKLGVNTSFGYQRDDLSNIKENTTIRNIASLSLNYAQSKKTSYTASYSDTSSFTSAKLNQFDTINDDNLLDNALDTLDYKQLTRSASFSMQTNISKKKDIVKSITTNYNVSQTANEQAGIIRIGALSTFHNMGGGYSVNIKEKDLSYSTMLNITYSTVGRDKSYTVGPTASVRKGFWDKKMSSSISSSYNQTQSETSTSRNMNMRFNNSYTLKEKHVFALNSVYSVKWLDAGNTENISFTFSYNYSF
ncbi:MAG: hypothetical protein HRT66_00145 [Flavobacteriaceae bacterium]|nr:hypothetical protein [Flavobacteriaceae bacterium]